MLVLVNSTDIHTNMDHSLRCYRIYDPYFLGRTEILYKGYKNYYLRKRTIVQVYKKHIKIASHQIRFSFELVSHKILRFSVHFVLNPN